MPRQLVVGVDSSTQSCKVEARRLDDGEVVCRGSAPHPPTQPPRSEQDPHAWWAALVDAVGQLPDDVRADVVAISVGGQQHGLVMLGADGEPLRPAKLWNDTTSAPQADRLVETVDRERWARLTGSVPVAAFTVTKLAWVVDNEPDVADRCEMVCLPHDYLTLRLTGEHVTDAGDASGTGWFNPTTGVYEAGLLDAAGVDGDGWLDRLPRVVRWREQVGTLRPDVATELGLPQATIVAPGSGDNMSGALGIGLASGDVSISLGTSGVAYSVSTTPTHDPSGAVAGFASATGSFLPLVCTLNATKVTDTVARWLGTDAPGLADLALTAADDAGSAILVPYFDGERTPNLPDATGTLVGLTNDTSAAQIALGAHDGVLCGILDGVDALAAAGAVLDGRLILVGGGARSVAYRQRLADLTFRDVVVPDADEAVATGAAVQAAMVYEVADPGEIVARWGIGTGSVVSPRNDARARRQRYEAASILD